MSEMPKRKRVRRPKTKEERAAEEETKATRPGAEERRVEEPQEEVEEARESAAEIPLVLFRKLAPEERPPLKHTVLKQYLKDPYFRRRVIYHLIKKLR